MQQISNVIMRKCSSSGDEDIGFLKKNRRKGIASISSIENSHFFLASNVTNLTANGCIYI